MKQNSRPTNLKEQPIRRSRRAGQPEPARDPRLEQQLFDLKYRVGSLMSGEKLWHELLTPSEQERLGGAFRVAYSEFAGTIGMWMKLRGVDYERAVIDAGRELGFLSESAHRALLEKCCHERPAIHPSELPNWSTETGELTFRGAVVRLIRDRGRAKNIVTVLNTFQEDGWPLEIDDPLTSGPHPIRLHSTIKSLNANLEGIRFCANGDGTGYRWRPA